MPTDQIKRFTNDAAIQARDLGGSAPSRPIGYLDDTDLLKYEDQGGTLRTVVDTDSAQTLSNKSLAGGLVVKEITFTETAGAGVYTGNVAVPAGATLIDVIVHATALWDNAGAVTMKVGITAVDDDGIYAAVDLKATDLLAAESLSFAKAGAEEGIDITATHVLRRYLATARTVAGIITTASTGGTAGRTRMIVIYAAPPTADITAATKV